MAQLGMAAALGPADDDEEAKFPRRVSSLFAAVRTRDDDDDKCGNSDSALDEATATGSTDDDDDDITGEAASLRSSTSLGLSTSADKCTDIAHCKSTVQVITTTVLWPI